MMPPIDPLAILAALGWVYLWALLILAVGCVVAVAIVSLWRDSLPANRDPGPR